MIFMISWDRNYLMLPAEHKDAHVGTFNIVYFVKLIIFSRFAGGLAHF